MTMTLSAYENEFSEHFIQCSLLKAFKLRREPGAMLFAIPNGGRRDAITGAILKREGVEAGAPDLIAGRNGRLVFLELKRVGGVVSRKQKKMHLELVTAGFEVVVCEGYLEAVQALEDRGIIRKPIVLQMRVENGRKKAKGQAKARHAFAALEGGSIAV